MLSLLAALALNVGGYCSLSGCTMTGPLRETSYYQSRGLPTASFPTCNTTTTKGAILYDTTTNLMMLCNGTAWVAVGEGSSSASALTLYVDPTGSDSNACTATGTAACLTPQGAVNKLPKELSAGATVNLAAGTYPGFYLTGFSVDTGRQQTTGGLTIQGTFASATGADGGTAVGTASSGAAGTNTTFGTLTDSTATWATNEWRGKFVAITGGTGSGQRRIVASNTSTVLTITGNWTAPDNTSTYAVQNAASVITPTTAPAAGGTASSANALAILIADNSINYNSGGITLSGLSLSGTASSAGVLISDGSDVTLSQDQIAMTTAPNVLIGDLSGIAGVGGQLLLVQDTYITSAGGFCVYQTAAGSAPTIWSLRAMYNGCNYGVFAAGAFLFAQRSYALNCDDICFATGVGGGLVQTSQLVCNAGSGRTGVSSGTGSPPANTAPGALGGVVSVSNTSVATCPTGVLASGPASVVSVTSYSGTAGVTGLYAELGGAVYFSSATTLTGTTQDINLDNGGATAAKADVASGTCLTNAITGSKVCQQ